VGRDDQRDVHWDVPKEGFAGRIEVLTGATGRRRWPDEVKARIVAESYAPGGRVADVARLHGTTRWQVYHWRKLARKGLLALPAPAGAAAAPAAPAAPAFAAVVVEEPPRTGAAAAAVLEIVVGEVVIRAPRAADEAQLARAIRAARMVVAR
jgi:transposase